MTYTIGIKISEDIKSKILNDLTYEQMIQVESDLNNYKWNSLLGEPPKDFDTLPNYESKWYKKTSLYKKLFKNRTKSYYIQPIKNYISGFITERDRLHYYNVVKYKKMTEGEFEKFWVEYCLRERVSIDININFG